MEQFLPTLTVSGVLALLAPLATTALKRLTWSPIAKQITAVVVAILVALLAITVTDGWKDIPGTENPLIYVLVAILVVIAVAQLVFKTIYEPLGIEAKVAAVTATKSEKAAFLAENTVPAGTTVDSTENRTAEAIAETDLTPPPPGYTPKH